MTEQLFQKLLIANRGEIACRIIRTARRLNIPSVAVYSDADRDAMHVRMADQAVYIGASRAAESYLNLERIMQAARQMNADAIHPGYGFLSENSQLSEACMQEGIEFIGPSAQAIRLMASKANAAKIAERADVPILPGHREAEMDDKTTLERVREIGFPVLIKAALGGGGRGMVIVESEEQFWSGLHTARAQAQEFFNDNLVIVEKYLNPARHIEVQIAADKHGNVTHLFDRDCTAQRRFQKIVEEAPAPGISERTRQQMYDAAMSLARMLNYHSVGTVEFLYANDTFYFMEMNTRLQVEHPVTEQVTHTDLVELQLQIAAGESISELELPTAPIGHSIQARIYAENPAKDFLPSPGRIEYLKFPAQSDKLQIHSGVQSDDLVDLHYDPLIAKLIVWDIERDESIKRLYEALDRLKVVGVQTNTEFVSNLIQSSAFQAHSIDVTFVESHLSELVSEDSTLPDELLALAMLFVERQLVNNYSSGCTQNHDYYSPWRLMNGWRVNSQKEFACSFEFEDRVYNVIGQFGRNHVVVRHKGRTLVCQDIRLESDFAGANIDGINWLAAVVQINDKICLFRHCKQYEITLSDRLSTARAGSGDSDSLIAPLPGRVARVMVKKGEIVSAGQCLIVIEAMKMEHQITSPIDGIVSAIEYRENQLVEEGASCALVEPIKPTSVK